MQLIEIAALDNGAHRNQTISENIQPPEGWAVIPEGTAIPETFPFVNLRTREAGDGESRWAEVVSLEAGTVPQEPEIIPTPAELRETAYQTEKTVEYSGKPLTVDQANKMYWEYFAEGDTQKAGELQALIAPAKETIREKYPDKSENE